MSESTESGSAAPGRPQAEKQKSPPKADSTKSVEETAKKRSASDKNNKQDSSESGSTSAKPKIGDTRPAPSSDESGDQKKDGEKSEGGGGRRRRRRRSGGGRKAEGESGGGNNNRNSNSQNSNDNKDGGQREGGGGRRSRSRRRGRGGRGNTHQPVGHVIPDGELELDEETLEQRRGRSRKGRPIGRYLMAVSKRADATHIAILEGRNLIEYYVSRPADDVYQIHGNIYLGRVQNVLPGMEAAFVDIGTPKNAVIYRGDVQHDSADLDGGGGSQAKIEQILRARQPILCQVTKNPIAHKGARLTTEVSLPGRFVVLVPNSSTYGISKRLSDQERKRLRQILDRVRPAEHGIIVRTAAENVTAAEIERDVTGLLEQWRQIEQLSKQAKAPALLYREPDMSTRVIREEFNKEYREVAIDDESLYEDVSDYVRAITPALAERVKFYDTAAEQLPLYERYHVHEQLHKALDKKVWLPSGGSLIIESTEALTVIDVNTGKNVGKSSLEETVFQNNLEAAEGIAHQLRLRDIGGIIVIDFVDMESKKNREEVMRVFRRALNRDKTRTQVFDISALGLVEMTRKRIGEGLLESLSVQCPHCSGRGVNISDGADDEQSKSGR